MGITYSVEKQKEWENFKINGGLIKFEIDSTDISSTKDFETFPNIQPNLTTGFEIPPTTLIHSPELQALIQIGGTDWDYILCRVYLAGGKVIYRKLSDDKYEALCTVTIKS